MSIVNTESLVQMFAILKDRLVLMLEIPYKTRMSLKEATCIEVKATPRSFELTYEKDGMKHCLAVKPGTALAGALANAAAAKQPAPDSSFYSLGHLRDIMKSLEDRPDDTPIHVQVVGTQQDGGAWYMHGQFGEVPGSQRGLVMSISHPDLPVLPDVKSTVG